MKLQSTFKSDLQKEQRLVCYLDLLYGQKLTYYKAHRVTDLKQQRYGIDLELKHLVNDTVFRVDEKAQLDYLNEDLPTFAFELSYLKNNVQQKGWLFDPIKKTDFYALITAIYSDEPEKFTSCKITFVNRFKLISFLASKKLTEKALDKYIKDNTGLHGKIAVKELDTKKEGYLFFSTKNKVEQPINLILKLDFLEENGLAKRLV